MIQTIQTEALLCTCEGCNHKWRSFAVKPPDKCPGCMSRAWNGKKKAGRPVYAEVHLSVPKPKRVNL